MTAKFISGFLLLFYSLNAWAEQPETAANFRLDFLDGSGTFNLEQTRGQVVLIDFWASWCGPCKVSLPELSKINASMRDKGFKVVAVNLDKDVEKAREFLKRIDVSYEVVHDPSGAVAELYEVPSMPTSVLLDREGNIRLVHKGFQFGDEKMLRNEIEALL
jgi:thiol-disulfide isomerase/thioredoxin